MGVNQSSPGDVTGQGLGQGSSDPCLAEPNVRGQYIFPALRPPPPSLCPWPPWPPPWSTHPRGYKKVPYTTADNIQCYIQCNVISNWPVRIWIHVILFVYYGVELPGIWLWEVFICMFHPVWGAPPRCYVTCEHFVYDGTIHMTLIITCKVQNIIQMKMPQRHVFCSLSALLTPICDVTWHMMLWCHIVNLTLAVSPPCNFVYVMCIIKVYIILL